MCVCRGRCGPPFGGRSRDFSSKRYPSRPARRRTHRFSGSKIEEFQVEILGVLENIGPRESIILAQLKGGPLENTGVMQGMSGSPVYIDGKLAGAVALGFPMSKEAIAGIRPIEEMLRVDPEPVKRIGASRAKRHRPGRQRAPGGNRDAGFVFRIHRRHARPFRRQLRDLGLDPRQGVSGGGHPASKLGDPAQLEPGSMISVQLLSGDMSVGRGRHGDLHRRQSHLRVRSPLSGRRPTECLSRARKCWRCCRICPSSFKISAAREWMGIHHRGSQHRDFGQCWAAARPLVPLEIRVGANAYHMKMIQDRVMTPLVTQMAVFSAIDATERSIGPSTFAVRGHIDFEGGSVRSG